MRGAKFYEVYAGELNAGSLSSCASDALRDVASWLGFTSIDDYVETLVKERERVFERAKDQPTVRRCHSV